MLGALRNVIDPDFGQDIVSCGFIKALSVSQGAVAVTIELTTPACPVKEVFKAQATQYIQVRSVCQGVCGRVRACFGRDGTVQHARPCASTFDPLLSGMHAVDWSVFAPTNVPGVLSYGVLS